MTFNLAAWGPAILAIVSFTGCALVYEGKYDWNQGWREAQVLKVGDAADMGGPQYSDCRKGAPPEQLATGRFALLSYRHMSRERRRVVPLKAQVLAAGDAIYMNVTSCESHLPLRVSRP